MPSSLRFPKILEPTVRCPLQTAALAAIVYVFISVMYILLSGIWAASLADSSAERLQTIETFKGIAFVVFSGLLFFGITSFLLKHIQRKEKVLSEQEKQLIQAQRKNMAMMCSASVAHDLNNYLMSLQGLTSGIREKAGDDEYFATLLHALETGSAKISRMAKHMTSSAKKEFPTRRDSVNLPEAVSGVLSLLRRHPNLRSVRIRLEEIPEITLSLNLFLFEEALMNLLVNAGQAAGETGEIILRCREENGEIVFEVHDNGPGIDPETAEDIFQPGFTTRQTGTGLGLLSVNAFLASCDGKITTRISELGGALFSMRIPQS